ncbi:hypothetical protein, partial [uncultured Thiocystis sp.]|uniref:hypothetical protein n=1 Tax=uncultured Thiocystis sp. TaxID=1202134 RepID=UPI0025EEB29A
EIILDARRQQQWGVSVDGDELDSHGGSAGLRGETHDCTRDAGAKPDRLLAKTLYPDRFPDLDLKREIRDHYARFYRYALSDSELDLMLQGKGPDGRRHNDMNN